MFTKFQISITLWKYGTLKKSFSNIFYAGRFFLVPHTTLYDEYIGRRKLTEQESPLEYVVPPPTKVGLKNYSYLTECHVFLNFF